MGCVEREAGVSQADDGNGAVLGGVDVDGKFVGAGRVGQRAGIGRSTHNNQVRLGRRAGRGDGGFEGGEVVTFGQVERDDVHVGHVFREVEIRVLRPQVRIFRGGKRHGAEQRTLLQKLHPAIAGFRRVGTKVLAVHQRHEIFKRLEHFVTPERMLTKTISSL